jgi:hypothetical protein
VRAATPTDAALEASVEFVPYTRGSTFGGGVGVETCEKGFEMIRHRHSQHVEETDMPLTRSIVAATLMLGLVLTAAASAEDNRAQRPHDRITFRFLVDSPLRPPNNPLEWVDGSPDDVLCFEGVVQHPSRVHVILGEAIGCARIVAQHPLEGGDAILSLKVRHIIQLTRGNIVDDDFAIVVPLLDSPTSLYTHGLTATTDINNIRPELSTGFYQGKDGIVGVNGNMDLRQFPDRILFNALFSIEFTS